MCNVHVILLKNTDRGRIGEVLKVKFGHAINFLVPQKIALLLNPNNKNQIDHYKKVIDRQRIAIKLNSDILSKSLEDIELSICARTTSRGKLFGSITSKEISQILNRRGYKINSKHILTESIKSIGCYQIKVILQDGRNISLKLVVISRDV